MLRELQALHDDPKMLQYAPWGLLPKMGAGRVDKEGQGIRHGRVGWYPDIKSRSDKTVSKATWSIVDYIADQLPRPV